ncbi:hypothetical protein TWF506_001307 [Arthrobotrys conoides]|uniref:SET domain-containing protein n=1 Tax=Arthrobotrys conoides TaxID=74498 RepID=A0AAN8NSY6_9PEZI
MEITAGFDLVPKLSPSSEDQSSWNTFISQLRSRYTSPNPQNVEFKENYILFNMKHGVEQQQPACMIPYAGHKFLRFSCSDINLKNDGDFLFVLYTVCGIAKNVFGKRVRWWRDDLCEDGEGFYSWEEVWGSWRCYDELNEPDPPVQPQVPPPSLFEIQTIPFKGRGLVATAYIPTGTRILTESPLFTIPSPPIPSLEASISKTLKTLPEEKQTAYHSLHNNYPPDSPQTPVLSGIFKTNALPCGYNSTVAGIYPTICLINHSCIPNTHHNWNENLEQETIHAIRPIKVGEELTISYISESISQPRRRKLKECFGFDCQCQLCTSTPKQLESSDERRRQIMELDGSIMSDAGSIDSNPIDCLKDCKRLLALLKQEYDGSAVNFEGGVYYDAFRVCIRQGDQARAKVMVGRAYEMRVLCEGEDSESSRDLKRLRRNPTVHKMYGLSMGSKSEVGDVPEGLEREEFEKWLWRS